MFYSPVNPGRFKPADTLVSRSICIDLKRQLPSEKKQRRPPDMFEQCQPLRRKMLRWAQDNAEDIRPNKIREGGITVLGYKRQNVEDAHRRYIGPSSSTLPIQSGTPEQVIENRRLDEKEIGTSGPVFHLENSHNSMKNNNCSGVPDCPSSGILGQIAA